MDDCKCYSPHDFFFYDHFGARFAPPTKKSEATGIMTRSQLRRAELTRQHSPKDDLGFKKMKNFEQDHIIPYNEVMPVKPSDDKNWKDVTFDFANQA